MRYYSWSTKIPDSEALEAIRVNLDSQLPGAIIIESGGNAERRWVVAGNAASGESRFGQLR